ncbi:MAG: glycoside hydrolase family 127 protein [Acidobacteriales bacterium]|nr:glycoside hydrolase family 127 protein [Terriglobales bacterium]
MRKLSFILLCSAAASTLAGGDLTARYHLTLDRVLTGAHPPYSAEMVLRDAIPESGRRFTEYSGDVSGRYLGALALASIESGRQFPVLDGLVPRLLGLQKPDGHYGIAFGDRITKSEMAMLWGNGRMLIGLLEYYRAKPRPETLAAARRLGDFLVKIAPVMNDDELRRRIDAEEFASGYICWTHNIEGLAELYRVTKDERYLQLAEEIAGRTRRYPKQHSHGFLSSVRGIVDIYKVTGEKKYLEQAEREWHGVIESGNLLVQGAVGEAFAPNLVRTEGCSEADWLRLTIALWRLTGRPEYLAQAERTLFNEFAMNQFNTGDFGHRPVSDTGTPLGQGSDGGGTARAWWCCTLHGLRAFPDILATVFRADGGTLYYDLPVDGRGKTQGLAMVADSTLERDATIHMKVTAADGRKHEFGIRQPAWAAKIAVSLNGAPAASPLREGYARVGRVWKTGDTLLVKYTLRTYVERNAKTHRVALFHGPWLLGFDDQVSPYFYDEPRAENRLRVAIANDGEVNLERARPVQATPFTVPEARFRVRYLPGGYPMLPSTAILRPVAEQTSTRSLPWEFQFLIEE